MTIKAKEKKSFKLLWRVVNSLDTFLNVEISFYGKI